MESDFLWCERKLLGSIAFVKCCSLNQLWVTLVDNSSLNDLWGLLRHGLINCTVHDDLLGDCDLLRLGLVNYSVLHYLLRLLSGHSLDRLVMQFLRLLLVDDLCSIKSNLNFILDEWIFTLRLKVLRGSHSKDFTERI